MKASENSKKGNNYIFNTFKILVLQKRVLVHRMLTISSKLSLNTCDIHAKRIKVQVSYYRYR